MNDSKVLPKKAGYLYFCVVGFLFVFFWKTGKNLADWGNIVWDGAYTWRTLGVSAVLGAGVGGICCFLLYLLAERSTAVSLPGRAPALWHRFGAWLDALSPRKFFLFSLLLILLAWLPAYLAYYPGICAYDSPVQVGQAVEGYYIDHHPILHTMLIKGFMLLGSKVLGSTNGGIALYTFLQMTLLAAAMSYGLAMLRRFYVKAGWQLGVLLLCMFYPFHWFMSVSMTKDTVFSSFVLVFLVALCVLLLEGSNSLKIGGQECLLIIGALGIVYFRNNGKYALMVPLVFLLLMVWRGKADRKLWLRLLLCCGGAFLAGNLGLSVLFETSGAQQGDRREMLSMPIQQLARTMLCHGGVGVLPEDDNTMAQEDRDLINDFILNEGYKLYEPGISDPVKRNTNTYVVRYRAADFLRTYLHLLRTYPGDFLNAALAVNAGFLYPNDITHATVNEEEGARNKGYVQTRWEEGALNANGIYKDSKWEWLHEKLEAWSEGNAYLHLGPLKYFFVPGVFLWYYLLLLGEVLIRKNLRMWLPISFVAGYYLTMFLGPTVQLRYLYPVMLALPFLALLCRRSKITKTMEAK